MPLVLGEGASLPEQNPTLLVLFPQLEKVEVSRSEVKLNWTGLSVTPKRGGRIYSGPQVDGRRA